MLSRKNSDKIGLKSYLKEQSLYFSLLKKELMSDGTSKSMLLTPLIILREKNG